MRRAGFAALILFLALGTLGCDTEQPVSAAAANVVLAFSTPSTPAPAWSLYDKWRDTNNDDEPDIQVTTLYDPDGPGPLPTKAYPAYECVEGGAIFPTKTPWFYAGEVRILRAGSTSQEVLAESTLSTPSMTVYDDTFGPDNPPPEAQPKEKIGEILFLNGKMYTAGSLETIFNCRYVPQGIVAAVPNAFGGPPSYATTLAPGDTLLVAIEKSNTAVFPPLTSPSIDASITVDGQPVPSRELRGTTSTGTGSSFYFSYTLR